MRKIVRRQRRKLRVRKRISGTAARPRFSVFRSHKNIYAQLIDDTVGRTLLAASSMDKAIRSKLTAGGNKAAAQAIGAALAAKAVEAGIKKVVFDRNGYAYHGRVQELADAARKGGLEF
ncbi:MAG TPA: 50S ribosomal protein L18 [Phycisphaerae bacterium]|nr:50S ribosomal protein L18 [Phycisphaerae bacterium]